MAVKTEIHVIPTGQSFSIPGDYTSSQIVANYASQLPTLGSLQVTTEVVATAEGEVRKHTFTARTGNKG